MIEIKDWSLVEAPIEEIARVTALYGLENGNTPKSGYGRVVRRWMLAPLAKNRVQSMISHMRHIATTYEEELVAVPSSERNAVRASLRAEGEAVVLHHFKVLADALTKTV